MASVGVYLGSRRRRSALFAAIMIPESESEALPASFFLSSPSSRAMPLLALADMPCQPLDTARIDDYVEYTVPRYTDTQFKWHFRMNRTSFQALLELVAPHTTVRTISLETRTLACIWYLSNQETFRSVADRFGLSKGSLHYYVRNFCNLLSGSVILPTLISWPKDEEFEHLAEDFSQRAGFPGVIGVIDGTYVPIPGPSTYRDRYICRKGFPAFHLQGVCDSKLRFLDVYSAYPGSVHDARVFRSCPLSDHLVEQPLPNQYHLLGDSAYGLTNHLLTPYRDDGHLSLQQKNYNLKHSQTRVDIERCFGLLKGKFRRLKYLDINSVSDIPSTIVACCALHNFIIGMEAFTAEDILSEEMQEVAEEAIGHAEEQTAAAKRDAIMQTLA